MDQKDTEKAEKEHQVRENLERIKRIYGHVPFITNMISKRPDLFLGYAAFTREVLFEPEHLDPKTTELAAISAGSALGAEHCLDVHLKQASKYGASDEEIFEALMVGAVMAMTRSQASSFRRFKEFQDQKNK